MRLQTIILINRAPFERLELNFGDENIAVLSGINGAGKTTILSYIVDSFYELAKKSFRNEFEDKPNKFYRVSSDLYSINSAAVSLVYLRFLKDDGSLADYIDIRGECTAEQYNGLVTFPNRIHFSLIEPGLKRHRVNKYWSISDEHEIEILFSNNLLTYFPAYRYESPAFLNKPYSVELEFKKESLFAGYLPNPIEVTSDLPQIANWIMDVVLDSKMYPVGPGILLNQINSIFSNILLSKVLCWTRVGIGPRTSGAERIAVMSQVIHNEVIYPSIFNMSSGELALLCLFGELVKQSDVISKFPFNVLGIVLIDEIDKHLHIRLQKETIPQLIAMFPNVQFISTSHSPFLGLGLAEANTVKYKIYDLDNGGRPCPPQDNELFREVYNMMISENDRFAAKYNNLEETIKRGTRPLVITEGKTDWKHLKSAMRVLGITDLDIELYEYEDTLGDCTLLDLLKSYARIQQMRRIIGVFDRDNFSKLDCDGLENQEYVSFQNNVFAFAIPLVNSEEYGNEISIEHYYKRDDLMKENSDGRRLFLGTEFYESGISKDHQFHTRAKGINTKCKNNGIVDEKVYAISDDPEEQNSLALTKNDFAELILNQDSFADGFDFSSFTKIFDVIRKIITDNESAN